MLKHAYVVVENTEGFWGSDLVCFVIPEESDLTENDVVEELRFAASKVEEDVANSETLMEESELEEMILNEVRNNLGVEWHYVRSSTFTYSILCE